MVLDCRNSTACEREELYCQIFVKTKCYEIFPNNSVCIYDDYYPNKTEGSINNKHKLINDLTTTELKRALHGPETLIARYSRLTHWPGLTEFGPPMWQAEADTELTLSSLPTTAVGKILLTIAKFC